MGMDGISGAGAAGAVNTPESNDSMGGTHGSEKKSGGMKSEMASMFGDIAKNQISQYAQQGIAQQMQGMQSGQGQQGGAPNFMSIIGSIFGGPVGAALLTGNAMELGGILGKIFDGIAKAGGNGAQGLTPSQPAPAQPEPAPTKGDVQASSDVEHETIRDHQIREANHSRDYVGVQEKVEVNGSYKADGIEMQGRAAAEAHAHASAESQSYNANGKVGAKAKVDASVGASAEVDGSIKTDVAQIAGRARISAEAAARAEAEAQASMEGASAKASSTVGVTSTATASSEMSALGGMVNGTADAYAEAGAGAKADAQARVSFNPPQAAVDAEAGAFAGARAGFSAKGGFPGGKAGITANVHAGVGARIEAHGELGADGKYRLSFGFGAALAVGFSFRVDVEIDMKNAGTAITGMIGAAGQIIGGLFQAVGGMFGGGKGDGSKANAVTSDTAKNIWPMLGQLGGAGGTPNMNEDRAKMPSGEVGDFVDTMEDELDDELDESVGKHTTNITGSLA